MFGKLFTFASPAGVSRCLCLPCNPHEVEKSCHQHLVLYGDAGVLWPSWLSLNRSRVPVGTVQPPVSGGPAVSVGREAPALLELWAQGHHFQFQLEIQRVAIFPQKACLKVQGLFQFCLHSGAAAEGGAVSAGSVTAPNSARRELRPGAEQQPGTVARTALLSLSEVKTGASHH